MSSHDNLNYCTLPSVFYFFLPFFSFLILPSSFHSCLAYFISIFPSDSASFLVSLSFFCTHFFIWFPILFLLILILEKTQVYTPTKFISPTKKRVSTDGSSTPVKMKKIVKKAKTEKTADSQIPRYNTKFEKKDLHEDVFLQLLNDFDLVPAVIKYVPFLYFSIMYYYSLTNFPYFH